MKQQFLSGEIMNSKDVENICRRAVAEGMTLLESDGMLPLNASDRVAVFGRAQFEYIKSGSGSGGLVKCPYVTNIGDELKKLVILDVRASDYYREWIIKHPYDNGDNWEIPQSQKEAPIDERFVKTLAEDNGKAIIVISRLCGESFDFKPEKGGYYLSDEEENTIELVSKYFKQTCVLLNVGNIIDMRWVKKYSVGTVAYVWQGGQEGGAGVAQALTGDLEPSGRLIDTIAEELCDYPAFSDFGDGVKNVHREDIYVGYRYFETFAKDRVLYPFGYGLSYTQFKYEKLQAEKSGDTIKIKVLIRNIGKNKGKDVIQCYVKKPQGKLGKPARELIAFKKTKLLQTDESEAITIEVNINEFASYDDCGKSGFDYAYVLESGEYEVFVGRNVRDAENVFSFNVSETVCVRQCRQFVAPVEKFYRLITKDGKTPEYEIAPLAHKEQAYGEQLIEIAITGDKGINLQDVAAGKHSVDEFIAQFSAKELCSLVRGEGMSSPKAPVDGTAGCLGGLTELMHDHGVPVITTVDGPSGVRLTKKDGFATCIPTGTLLASAWSQDIVYDVFDIFAKEMRSYNLDVALAPGMNIHRHVLGGRNFEYFSEDPLVTGVNAVTIAKCFYDNGVRCTLKHFAVNSQERERGSENEVLSERALREIYLKGFEIAVKSGYVQYVMSAYNRINGLSVASNYELLSGILRDEWGFKGVVMTDWWTKIDDPIKGTFGESNLAAMVRAQNDVYMVTSDITNNFDDLESALQTGELTIAHLQRSARNIFNASIDSLAYKYFDRSKPFIGNVCEYPVASYDGSQCCVKLDNEGIYSVKITYTCSDDALIQNEEKIFFNGNERQTILLKGTCGKVKTHSFLMYLHPNAVIGFQGSAEIKKIELYKINEKG